MITVRPLTCLVLVALADVHPADASFEWTLDGPYEGEGICIEGSAEAAGVMTAVFVGGLAAWVCLPGDLVHSAIRRQSALGVLSHGCAIYVGVADGWAAYIIAGAPFFAVKKVFWDAPRRLLGIQTNSSDPDPPRSVPPSPCGALLHGPLPMTDDIGPYGSCA